jgi:undecaprenyl-diphosphatase
MPAWIAAVILGIIEGVTEFLPVSSTGHLLIAEIWLPRQSDMFNVVIQVGAVLAVILAFSGRLKTLLLNFRERANQIYLGQLAAAFIVTAVGGLLIKALGFELPEDPGPVLWATLIGGILILVIERTVRPGVGAGGGGITWPMALGMGLAQVAAAGFPGLSRSGATIMLALCLGAGRPQATEFSFLLGVPTLMAAAALELLKALKTTTGESWTLVAIGFVTAAATAFLTVRWLVRFVQTHTFEVFGWYRIVLALVLFWLVYQQNLH